MANRSGLEGQTLSGGSSKRIHARAAGGMIMPPKGSTQRGVPSGRFFGDFLIGEKVTRVQGGAPASGGAGAPSSAKSGARDGAPAHRGVQRGPRPLAEKLLPRATPVAQKQKEAGKESLSRLPVTRIFPYLMEFS